MRSRVTSARLRVVALLIGVLAIAAGCLLPQFLLFGLGVVVVAVAIAAWGRWWTRAATAVAISAALVSVPLAWGHLVTNREVSWDASDVTGFHAGVGDRAYVEGDGELQVVNATTGVREWSTAQDLWGIGHDGAVITRGELPSALSSDGSVLWSGEDVDWEGEPEHLIARNDGVTVFASGDLVGISSDPITLTAVDDAGDVAWSDEIRNVGLDQGVSGETSTEPFLRRSLLYVGAPSFEDVPKSSPLDGTTHVIDVATGKEVYDSEGSSSSTVNAARASDAVLFIVDSNGRFDCTMSLVRGDTEVWDADISSDQCSSLQFAPVATFDQRMYFPSTPSSLTTIDLSDGTLQTLKAKDPRFHSFDGSSVMTPSTFVRVADGKIRALDAHTGDSAWEQEAVEDTLVFGGRYVIVTEPSRTPNPILRPGLTGLWTTPKLGDDSRQVRVLDPQTGEELASVVDSYGAWRKPENFHTVEGGVLIDSDNGQGLFIAIR